MECRKRRFSSRRAAITAQQLCSNDDDESLIGRDGMSKTTLWKKCAHMGTSHMRKRSLVRACRCHREAGLLFTHAYATRLSMRYAQVAPLTAAVPPKLSRRTF